jgi:hypothetical protein
MFSPAGEDAFLIDAQRDFFPPTDLLQTKVDYASDVDSVQGERRAAFEALAISLARVGIAFDRRWEAWALGPTSALVAQFLNHISNTSPQIMDAEHKGSLILIDRTLDLASPLTFGFECLADRYYNIQKSLQSNTTAAGQPQVNLPMENPTLSFNINMQQHSKLFDILSMHPKECFGEIRKLLVDLIHEIGAEIPNLSSVRSPAAAVATLLDTIVHFDAGGGPSLIYRNAPLIIAAQAACYLGDENVSAEAAFAGVSLASYALAKHLLATQDLQNVVDHLKSLAEDKKSASKPFDIRMAVTTVALALALIEEETTGEGENNGWSEFAEDPLAEIKAAMVQLLLSRPPLCRPNWVDANVFEMLQEHHTLNPRPPLDQIPKSLARTIEDVVDSLFGQLQTIRTARSMLQDYPRVVPQPGKLIPIPCQVLSHVLDKRDVPLQDLQQISFSVRGLIKSGLGRLVFRQSVLPRPTDRPTIAIFIVGGITCSELHELREIASHHLQSHDIIFGSTRILTALDVHDAITS